MIRWIDPAVLHQIHKCSDISLISPYPRELQIWMSEVLGTVPANRFLAASEMSFCTVLTAPGFRLKPFAPPMSLCVLVDSFLSCLVNWDAAKGVIFSKLD